MQSFCYFFIIRVLVPKSYNRYFYSIYGRSPLNGDIPNQWAINYKDLLEANLIRLDYIFKDTKTDEIVKPIIRLEKEFKELKVLSSTETQTPFIFN